MTNRRAKRTEKFRSKALKADITVGNIQIRQTGGIVMTRHNELTREKAFHIDQLKCHFTQAFYSGALIIVTYATEPIHYQISECDFSSLAPVSCFHVLHGKQRNVKLFGLLINSSLEPLRKHSF